MCAANIEPTCSARTHGIETNRGEVGIKQRFTNPLQTAENRRWNYHSTLFLQQFLGDSQRLKRSNDIVLANYKRVTGVVKTFRRPLFGPLPSHAEDERIWVFGLPC